MRLALVTKADRLLHLCPGRAAGSVIVPGRCQYELRMWNEQLNSMMEADHLDGDTISDFGITYTAETGDDSFVRTQISFGHLPSARWKFNGSISISSSGERGVSWSEASGMTTVLSSFVRCRSGSASGRTSNCSESISIGRSFPNYASESWSRSICLNRSRIRRWVMLR